MARTAYKVALVLLGTLLRAAAQEPVAASHVEVRLEVKNGQTQFQLGDLIRLELVFLDAAPSAAGHVDVNTTDYGDIADDVTIQPADGWFQWRARSGHDYMMQTPLEAADVRVPLVLNQGYVFREPGHYEITVTTARAGHGPVTTNAIDIDIAARDPSDEAALVKTLDATILGATGIMRKNAAERLAALAGDDAARAKVRWLLELDQDIARAMTNGLAATRNQALQLELLKAAWVNPEQVPDGTLQTALRMAEGFASGQTKPVWPQTPRLESEYRADLDRVIATLPQRTGDVRSDTAYFLMEFNELSADQLARLKPVVLEEFPNMEPIAQSMLIETRWDAVKDPSLAPYLKAMIESKAQYNDAATAIQRLLEIDEPAARPYVVNMICRPRGGASLDNLEDVKEDRLPEVDDCLAALLAKGEQREHDFEWEQAAQRAARFATPAILPRVKAAWKNASQDASMLALLIRDAPKEAVALLDREPEIDWFPANQVYQSLGGRFPQEVLAWLRAHSASVTVALDELAQSGEAQDRALLEQRLQTLRNKWAGREAEMNDAELDSPGDLAESEELELVGALLQSKAWTLTAEEKLRITSGCLSDFCRQFAASREAAGKDSGPTAVPSPAPIR